MAPAERNVWQEVLHDLDGAHVAIPPWLAQARLSAVEGSRVSLVLLASLDP